MSDFKCDFCGEWQSVCGCEDTRKMLEEIDYDVYFSDMEEAKREED